MRVSNLTRHRACGTMPPSPPSGRARALRACRERAAEQGCAAANRSAAEGKMYPRRVAGRRWRPLRQSRKSNDRAGRRDSTSCGSPHSPQRKTFRQSTNPLPSPKAGRGDRAQRAWWVRFERRLHLRLPKSPLVASNKAAAIFLCNPAIFRRKTLDFAGAKWYSGELLTVLKFNKS